MNKTDCTITSLSFAYYTPDEIRKIAEKQVTSLISIEPTLGKGAANGLYDSSLGSLSDREPCRNCNLSFYDCNGHYGRIEFPKPIYHPMLFDNLVKLLKGSCFYCHKLSYGQGFYESICDLGNKDKSSIKKFNDFDELKSLSAMDKEKLAVKIMGQQTRKICALCNHKPLVFQKSRKAEILAHISSKNRQNKDEPDNKKMKLDNPMPDKKFKSIYTEQDLYGKFTDNDQAIYPEIIREHLRLLWINEHENLKLIFPMLKSSNFEYATDVFFMENMLINPPMNRLPAIMNGDQMTESPETTNMVNVVRASIALQDMITSSKTISEEQKYQNIREGILDLQKRTNTCYDSNTHREINGRQPGLRQKIDKKEGLFRQNIMGKRVNFACRSVISPDPNIGLNEIGVPIIFLTKLKFPEPMNPLNKEFLKKCILNGPDMYPGAVSYQINNHSPMAILNNREATVEYLELMTQQNKTVIINRHAISGDALIMNRQPTLHRPSMQAHLIKAILDPKAKTLRMNYSNCKAYNADFDGDEMNGHYPQSILAQTEAKKLMNVCYNHSTPKDGSPLAGLIQDHVIAGTRMCMRNCTLERREYIDLVFFGLKDCKYKKMKLLKPAIMYPKRLWTGKQVLSTILINSVPEEYPLPNIVVYEPKKNALWQVSETELKLGLSDVELIINNGYICTGSFDKAHIGPSQKGLCTDLRELYGPETQLHILTCLSRVLNRYLIYTGFSTNIKDGFLNKNGDNTRKTICSKIRTLGLTSIAAAFNLKMNEIDVVKVNGLMEKAHFDKSDEFRNKMSEMDSTFKTLSVHYINQMNKECKANLLESFPFNNLSFMSNTGAKGGESNVTKIAIGLGAIEIEGKRCPLTVSGKTLPSFKRYDFDPASRGFCSSRFTSGLKPQELFFESMAGRDGLVDTAVKTSSSGYLQRCLIKQLEDITVFYDATVRDNMENIIQFKYGYDGLDVINSVAMERSDIKDIITNNFPLYRSKYLKNNKYSDEKALEKIISMKKDIAAIQQGEAVGLLAAQSIGEPSTQMTLNTFHNAGQSEMNVTLGIPRMREILMLGSEKINTPSMTVPILPEALDNGNARLVLKKFNRLHMKDVIKLPLNITRTDNYEIKFSFKKKHNYINMTTLETREMIPLIEKTFFKSLAKILKKFNTKSKADITDCRDEEYDAVLNDALEKNEDGDNDNNEAKEMDNEEENNKKDENDDGNSDLSDIDDIGSNHDADEEIENITDDNDSDGNDNEDALFKEDKNSNIVEMCPIFFHSYNVHKNKNPKWIKLTINFKDNKVDLKSLLLNLLETTIISSVEGIDKALIIAKDNCFATEGYNQTELMKYDTVFDLNRFYTNNVVKMSKLYGIESAISCIEKEVMTVFKSYSIDVNRRHLRLIADFMTFSGSVSAFNRHCMKNHSSQIQRASYETALTVLNEMMIHSTVDSVKSPSTNIMLGQPVANIGSNAMELLFNRNNI